MFLLILFLSWPIYGDLIDDPEELEQEAVKAPPIRSYPKSSPYIPKSQESAAKLKPSKIIQKRTVSRPSHSSQQPIRLKSDGRSTYSKDGGVVHLEKNVVITQADLHLRADQAKVILDTQDVKNSVKTVEIFGAVKVSRHSNDPEQAVTAKANRALFSNDKQQVILVGNARLWRGGQLIKGKKITYSMESGMVMVDQAQGVVSPEVTPIK